MQTPDFFAAAPRILLRDPLAELLGAATDGILEYTYLDAVKLAGHSCPTVAGAYLMTAKALQQLYRGELPRRGEVRVEIRQRQDEGVAGVIGSVVGLLTGAAGDGGFKGLAGRFGRRGLLQYGAAIAGDLRFTDVPGGRSVEASYHMEAVERPPALQMLLQSALAPTADTPTRRAFADAWQEWVRRVLIEHADDPALVSIRA